MVYEEGVRVRSRTYMRQKKGGDVTADIYRDRSSRGTGVFTDGPLSQCHSHAQVSLALANRDVASHQ